MTKAAESVSSGLRKLDSGVWHELRAASADQGRWDQREWWHNKYYRDSASRDGNVLQQPGKGEPEVPYKRELFYPSPNSRFSLGEDGCVAYFSKDFAANCCETIEQFSSNPDLSFEELSNYLGGEGNPTLGWFGYPMSFHLARDTLIMDVSMCSSPFFDAVSRTTGSEAKREFWRVFTSRDSEDKSSTQLVARDARRNAYDGIVYASVRTPVEVGMPDWNLVMFSPEKVLPGTPPAVS